MTNEIGLEVNCGSDVTMAFAHIPPGRFTMGSPTTEAGRNGGEGPQRQVTITKPFHLAVTAVTQAQWHAVMASRPWEGMMCVQSDAHTAASWITWNEAVEFCGRLSAATGLCVCVPTEAEWEYACRARTTTRFHYGEDPAGEQLGSYAWHEGNAYDCGEHHAHRAGQKTPNPWGLYDMHGNVWEWCADWRDESYDPADTIDPKGPASGTARILRGGSWANGPHECRSATRRWHAPGYRSGLNGLRPVVLAGSATP